MRPLIGLAGKARCGKDTVAGFILAEQGGYRYGLADPIRDMMRCLGIDMDDPYWQQRKEEPVPILGVSPRHMMQTLGTDWGRKHVRDDLWLIMAQRKYLANGPGMIISDVRFDNEADFVRQRGLLIHVVRPGAASVRAHESEAGVQVKDGDAVIVNDGSLEDLQVKVMEVLNGVK